MHLYYRVCEKEQAISYVERYNNYSKKTILRKCWTSLKDQITDEDKVIFIHDEVCDETLQWLDNSTTRLREFIAVPKHEWDNHLHNVVLFDTLESRLQENNKFHFLIEDDYLYAEDALATIRSIEGIYSGFFVPQDYPDRYKEKVLSQIMLGPTCHWRTVSSSTWNMGGSAKVWEEILPIMKAAAVTSNDKVLEDIYKRKACISPIPGVATHLTNNHPTPFFQINKRLEELQIA